MLHAGSEVAAGSKGRWVCWWGCWWRCACGWLEGRRDPKGADLWAWVNVARQGMRTQKEDALVGLRACLSKLKEPGDLDMYCCRVLQHVEHTATASYVGISVAMQFLPCLKLKAACHLTKQYNPAEYTPRKHRSIVHLGTHLPCCHPPPAAAHHPPKTPPQQAAPADPMSAARSGPMPVQLLQPQLQADSARNCSSPLRRHPTLPPVTKRVTPGLCDGC